MNITRVRVKQSVNGEYYFAAFASNGEEIERSSETYKEYSYAAKQALELYPNVTVLHSEGDRDVSRVTMNESGLLEHTPIGDD